MKINRELIVVAVMAILFGLLLGGAGAQVASQKPTPLVEGVIYYVEWTAADGSSFGLTRLDSSQAVPGGNGSWKIDMYGKLYESHLEIQYPKSKDLGPQIIPMSRVVTIQFGDGGIKEVAP